MVTLVCDLPGRSQHPSCHEGLAHCPFMFRKTTGTACSQAKRDTQAVREVCWPLKGLSGEGSVSRAHKEAPVWVRKDSHISDVCSGGDSLGLLHLHKPVLSA